MEKLIQFRSFVHKLKDKEYELFLLQLLPIISNKENMSTILFHHFNELHSINKYEEVQNVNDILSTILNDRKKPTPELEPNENIPSTSPDGLCTDSANKEEVKGNICYFDDPPNELISEIVSYFSFGDYLNFQKINRRMFIICKSPIKFTHLSAPFCVEKNDYCFTSYLSKYLQDCRSNQPITNYFNFRNLNSLCVDLDHLNYWSLLNRNHNTKINNIFESIENVVIDCSGTKRGYQSKWNIFTQSAFKDNIIKNLSLTNRVDNDVAPNILCELIPHFPHLESLQIGGWDQDNDINIDSWSDEVILALFSNLKTLNLFEGGSLITDRIVKVIGHKLEHIGIDLYADTAFSENGWGNLIELDLCDVSQIAVDNITKTAKNIQKISISVSTYPYKQNKNVEFGKLIKQQKKLKYLYIGCCVYSLNQTVISLLLSLTVNPLKIRLDLSVTKNLDEWDDAVMCQRIKDVINAVRAATKNNFCLIICSKFKLPKIDLLSLDASFGRLDYLDKEYYLMVKSNQYQMYGGYTETWMNFPNYFLK